MAIRIGNSIANSFLDAFHNAQRQKLQQDQMALEQERFDKTYDQNQSQFEQNMALNKEQFQFSKDKDIRDYKLNIAQNFTPEETLKGKPYAPYVTQGVDGSTLNWGDLKFSGRMTPINFVNTGVNAWNSVEDRNNRIKTTGMSIQGQKDLENLRFGHEKELADLMPMNVVDNKTKQIVTVPTSVGRRQLYSGGFTLNPQIFDYNQNIKDAGLNNLYSTKIEDMLGFLRGRSDTFMKRGSGNTLTEQDVKDFNQYYGDDLEKIADNPNISDAVKDQFFTGFVNDLRQLNAADGTPMINDDESRSLLKKILETRKYAKHIEGKSLSESWKQLRGQ